MKTTTSIPGDRHRHAKVTERLSAVYATEPSHLDPALHEARVRGIEKGEQ